MSAARDLLMEAACQAQTARNTGPGHDNATDIGNNNDKHRVRPLFGRTLHSKALELYAAALEIDSVDARPEQHLIAMRLCTSWPDLRARDPHTLRPACTL
ncbi:hypothetical protein [Streptomyces sp. NPDC007991]|uniref:hypothetical protein n=1 Tax=Streptomyces sp. NPDC007991 TaxID=3364803 RepID=UPI0036E48BCB